MAPISTYPDKVRYYPVFPTHKQTSAAGFDPAVAPSRQGDNRPPPRHQLRERPRRHVVDPVDPVNLRRARARDEWVELEYADRDNDVTRGRRAGHHLRERADTLAADRDRLQRAWPRRPPPLEDTRPRAPATHPHELLAGREEIKCQRPAAPLHDLVAKDLDAVKPTCAPAAPPHGSTQKQIGGAGNEAPLLHGPARDEEDPEEHLRRHGDEDLGPKDAHQLQASMATPAPPALADPRAPGEQSDEEDPKDAHRLHTDARELVTLPVPHFLDDASAANHSSALTSRGGVAGFRLWKQHIPPHPPDWWNSTADWFPAPNPPEFSSRVCPVAARYEEVLTHVGGVSLFVEPCVELAEVVFFELHHVELEDDVITYVGGASLFLEVKVVWDVANVDYIDVSSFFLNPSVPHANEWLDITQPWQWPYGRDSAHLVFCKILPWNRSAFSPGQGNPDGDFCMSIYFQCETTVRQHKNLQRPCFYLHELYIDSPHTAQFCILKLRLLWNPGHGKVTFAHSLGILKFVTSARSEMDIFPACSSHVEKGDKVAVSVAMEQLVEDNAWAVGMTRGTVLQGMQGSFAHHMYSSSSFGTLPCLLYANPEICYPWCSPDRATPCGIIPVCQLVAGKFSLMLVLWEQCTFGILYVVKLGVHRQDEQLCLCQPLDGITSYAASNFHIPSVFQDESLCSFLFEKKLEPWPYWELFRGCSTAIYVTIVPTSFALLRGSTRQPSHWFLVGTMKPRPAYILPHLTEFFIPSCSQLMMWKVAWHPALYTCRWFCYIELSLWTAYSVELKPWPGDLRHQSNEVTLLPEIHCLLVSTAGLSHTFDICVLLLITSGVLSMVEFSVEEARTGVGTWQHLQLKSHWLYYVQTNFSSPCTLRCFTELVELNCEPALVGQLGVPCIFFSDMAHIQWEIAWLLRSEKTSNSGMPCFTHIFQLQVWEVQTWFYARFWGFCTTPSPSYMFSGEKMKNYNPGPLTACFCASWWEVHSFGHITADAILLLLCGVPGDEMLGRGITYHEAILNSGGLHCTAAVFGAAEMLTRMHCRGTQMDVSVIHLQLVVYHAYPSSGPVINISMTGQFHCELLLLPWAINSVLQAFSDFEQWDPGGLISPEVNWRVLGGVHWLQFFTMSLLHLAFFMTLLMPWDPGGFTHERDNLQRDMIDELHWKKPRPSWKSCFCRKTLGRRGSCKLLRQVQAIAWGQAMFRGGR